MGKAARRPSPTQSAGDEVEGLPAGAETVEDSLSGGVEFIDPVDRGAVPGDVGGEAPVPCAVGGAEELAESSFGPSKEVQEPLREGLADAVLPPACEGFLRRLGFKGAGVDFGSRSPHGPFGHSGVAWALPDEASQGSVPQVGDVEVGEAGVVGHESVGPGGGSEGVTGVLAVTRARMTAMSSCRRPMVAS